MWPPAAAGSRGGVTAASAALGVAAVTAGDAAALMLQPRAALGAELGQLGLGGGHIGVGVLALLIQELITLIPPF